MCRQRVTKTKEHDTIQETKIRPIKVEIQENKTHYAAKYMIKSQQTEG